MTESGPVKQGVLRDQPAQALSVLTQFRAASVGLSLVEWQSSPESPVPDAIANPVNPVLLSTVFSLAAFGDEVADRMTWQYVRGGQIPDIEERFLDLSSRATKADFVKVLHLENAYIHAFTQLGIEEVVEKGPLIEEDRMVTIWDARAGAWLAANPLLGAGRLKAAWRCLASYSYQFNSSIHNAREVAQHLVDNVSGSLNSVLLELRNSDRDRAIKELAEHHRTLTLLVERAFTLYRWCPHEIHAHSASAAFMLKVLERVKAGTLTEPEVDVGELEMRCTDERFPTEAEQRLKQRYGSTLGE